jgi:hypothetical protein
VNAGLDEARLLNYHKMRRELEFLERTANPEVERQTRARLGDSQGSAEASEAGLVNKSDYTTEIRMTPVRRWMIVAVCAAIAVVGVFIISMTTTGTRSVDPRNFRFPTIRPERGIG